MNNTREKLIELLSVTSLEFEEAVTLADYLLANGVTIQKKSQKVKPRKRKHKAITIETMTALEAMGRKAHRGE